MMLDQSLAFDRMVNMCIPHTLSIICSKKAELCGVKSFVISLDEMCHSGISSLLLDDGIQFRAKNHRLLCIHKLIHMIQAPVNMLNSLINDCPDRIAHDFLNLGLGSKKLYRVRICKNFRCLNRTWINANLKRILVYDKISYNSRSIPID